MKPRRLASDTIFDISVSWKLLWRTSGYHLLQRTEPGFSQHSQVGSMLDEAANGSL